MSPRYQSRSNPEKAEEQLEKEPVMQVLPFQVLILWRVRVTQLISVTSSSEEVQVQLVRLGVG